MILGTISAIDDDNGLQLIIDGEDSATTKKYTYISSYVPTANDRVLIEEISGSYVIMGKVINDVTASGIAREAVNATNAVNAVNADNATTATTATTATKLDSSKYGVSGGYVVTNVHQSYNSQIGNYIDSISLGSYIKFVYEK